jgi:hypothetical protein
MSHITKVKTEIKDGRILKQALERIGYRVQDGGLISSGYASGPREKVDILAHRNGQSIGFRRPRSDDGSYELLSDWGLRGVNKAKIIPEIFRSYSREKVLQLARSKGYAVVTNETNRHGQIEIVLRKVV